MSYQDPPENFNWYAFLLLANELTPERWVVINVQPDYAPLGGVFIFVAGKIARRQLAEATRRALYFAEVDVCRHQWEADGPLRGKVEVITPDNLEYTRADSAEINSIRRLRIYPGKYQWAEVWGMFDDLRLARETDIACGPPGREDFTLGTTFNPRD